MNRDMNRPVEEAAAQADGAIFTDVVGDLREFASNPGYSHGDYADTMRKAANTIESLRAGFFNYAGIVADKPAAAPTAQPTPPDDELPKIVRGLEVAMRLADAVPTEAHKHEDELKWFGEVVNVHGGYDAIRDGLEAARRLEVAATEAERATWSFKQWWEHVGAWETPEGFISFGSPMAVRAMLIQFRRMVEARAALRHPPVTNGAGSIDRQLTGTSSPVKQAADEPIPSGVLRAVTELTATQPTQAGAEPAAAATIDTEAFRERFSYMLRTEYASLVGLIDAAIAAAREEEHQRQLVRIRHLERERDGARANVEAFHQAACKATAEAADLRARLASAGAGEEAANAARYRWLRDTYGICYRQHCLMPSTFGRADQMRNAADLDKAIDRAARQDSAAADKGE